MILEQLVNETIAVLNEQADRDLSLPEESSAKQKEAIVAAAVDQITAALTSQNDNHACIEDSWPSAN
jgi:hypothetical protein